MAGRMATRRVGSMDKMAAESAESTGCLLVEQMGSTLAQKLVVRMAAWKVKCWERSTVVRLVSKMVEPKAVKMEAMKVVPRVASMGLRAVDPMDNPKAEKKVATRGAKMVVEMVVYLAVKTVVWMAAMTVG
jgi:hypothetical protein